jgi:O-antigen ligase
MQSRREAVSSRVEDQQRESIGHLITDLANQSAGLVRDEVALAKQEVSEKLLSLRSGVIMIALGAFVGLIAALALCAAAIVGLAEYLEPWLAALVVGGVLAVIAGIIGFTGLGQVKRVNLKPEVTIQTLEEDKQWLKEIT